MVNNRLKFRAWSYVSNSMLEDIQYTEKFETYLKSNNYEVMQCTGIKDKNNILIYEGDIVLVFHVSSTMQPNINAKFVEWNEEKAKFNLVDDTDDVYTIIGNIYTTSTNLESDINAYIQNMYRSNNEN